MISVYVYVIAREGVKFGINFKSCNELTAMKLQECWCPLYISLYLSKMSYD